MSYSAVLRIPAFRYLWLGQAISQLGDSFYYVSFMFMVQKVTGSIAMVGIVGACETVPYLLFSLYGGVLADRFDRKTIMLWSDLLSGISLVLLAALTLAFGRPPVWSLLATPFLLSSVRSFFMPAKSAAIPALVPPDALMTANALSSTTQSFVPMVSLSLTAGVLSLFYSRSAELFLVTAVLLNSASFFGSACYILLLPSIKPDRVSIHNSHPWKDLKEGLRYIVQRPVLVVLLAVLTSISLSVSPFFVVYIAANNRWFGGKPQSLALFEMSFFMGMVVSSLWVGRLKITKPGLSFIAGSGAVGVLVVAMAFSPIFTLFIVWNFACGIGVPFSDIPVRTWLQLVVPDAFRGRVNSVFSMLGMGVMPIGLCMGGMLVARAGLEWAFVVMGMGMVVAALGGLLSKAFRRLEMPSSTEAEIPVY